MDSKPKVKRETKDATIARLTEELAAAKRELAHIDEVLGRTGTMLSVLMRTGSRVSLILHLTRDLAASKAHVAAKDQAIEKMLELAFIENGGVHSGSLPRWDAKAERDSE